MADVLSTGDKVEVRRRFDAGWARGFEVVDVNDDGVQVRRLSDGEVIPMVFPADEVRKERHRNQFWWM